MTEDQIKHMAERFLMWKLPENFNPDGGISFDPISNRGFSFESRRQPVGTNLWGLDDAIKMVRHMTQDLPKSGS